MYSTGCCLFGTQQVGWAGGRQGVPEADALPLPQPLSKWHRPSWGSIAGRASHPLQGPGGTDVSVCPSGLPSAPCISTAHLGLISPSGHRAGVWTWPAWCSPSSSLLFQARLQCSRGLHSPGAGPGAAPTLEGSTVSVTLPGAYARLVRRGSLGAGGQGAHQLSCPALGQTWCIWGLAPTPAWPSPPSGVWGREVGRPSLVLDLQTSPCVPLATSLSVSLSEKQVQQAQLSRPFSQSLWLNEEVSAKGYAAEKGQAAQPQHFTV